MANPDSVAQLYLDSFSNARIAVATSVNLATVANNVANLALTSGGLTNGGAVSNSGGVIVRKITATTLNGSVSSAYVTITTSNDGNASNAIVANVQLTALSAAGRFQDLTIANPTQGNYAANTVVSGSTTSALFVNVTTPSGNSNTVNFNVYGDVVSF
jgi:hypothetical protein